MTSGSDTVSVLARSWLLPAILLLACLLPGAAVAAPDAAPAAPEVVEFNLTELMRSLSQVNESTAIFVERKYLALLKTPLEFSGTLAYNAPSHLEKITLQPKPESLVLDGDKLVIRTGPAQQQRVLSLQEYPAIWALVESIRSTLAGDLETLNRFYLVVLEGTAQHWQLLLQPRAPDMKSLVSEISISGSGTELTSIEIRETEGDYSVMRISRDDS